MDQRTIRQTAILLPGLADDPELTPAAALTGDKLADFRYSDHHLRDLAIYQTTLSGGKISRIGAQRASIDGATLTSIIFEDCELASISIHDSHLSRVVFRNCQLSGARLDNIRLADVIFDGCRLDYAALTEVRISQPVAFTGCTLRASTLDRCDLTGSVFDNCRLSEVEITETRMTNVDLRGNDLTGLRPSQLRRAIIDTSQIEQITQGSLVELEISIQDL